jgi:integrase/recombinase XerD
LVRAATIKSLLTFGWKIGALPLNVGAAWKPGKRDSKLAARILSESEIQRMLVLTKDRTHVLVRLSYAGAFRIAETVAIRWIDIADAEDGTMYVTVTGKGDKTRTVRIYTDTANVLRDWRSSQPDHRYVFAGRGDRPISSTTGWRIVSQAAVTAGIKKAVSPHFLRHSHASHAINRGAAVTTVRDTLGHSSLAVTDRYAHARPDESSGRYLAV